MTDLVAAYLAMRELRLTKKKEVDKLEEQEKELKGQITQFMRDGKVKAIGPQASRVTLQKGSKPVVEDWTKVYRWIFLKGEEGFGILQRRLTESVVTEFTEGKKTIPGIDFVETWDITISKE